MLSEFRNWSDANYQGAAWKVFVAALRTSTNFAASSNGFPWAVGTCGTGMELTAAGTMCICTNGYILRPCDNYTSWGGIDGLTCAAPSQSITVSFE
ncbi:unnamed protein product [Rotaria magnacalcarata]|uniref:Uncharacterized protein n=1 Tax=Rotaria magnacalcarata TaxID=392030 RepID=A0A8S3DRP5_9BILA|nr:unnamed protein product [Rotaria magnacalcarata]